MALPLIHLLCPFFVVIVVTFVRFFSRILQNFGGTLVAFLLFYYPVHQVKLFLSWGWRSRGWKGVLCPFIIIVLTLTTLLGHILLIFKGIFISFLLF